MSEHLPGSEAVAPLPAERFFEACSSLLCGISAPDGSAEQARAARCAQQMCPPAASRALPSPWGHYRNLGSSLQRLRGLIWPRQVQIDDAALALQRALRPDPAHTIAVVLPWGAPSSPLVQPSAAEYLRLARRLMIRHPGCRLWVQTLDHDVWRQFRDAFGERCSNLWIADGGPSLGRTPVSGFRAASWADDLQVAQLQFAMVQLLAQSRWVVTHTGHVGLWLCLLRGHARGVWQIDDEGLAVNPDWPGGWFGALHRCIRKVARGFAKPVERAGRHG